MQNLRDHLACQWTHGFGQDDNRPDEGPDAPQPDEAGPEPAAPTARPPAPPTCGEKAIRLAFAETDAPRISSRPLQDDEADPAWQRPQPPLVLRQEQRRLTTDAAKARKIWDVEPRPNSAPRPTSQTRSTSAPYQPATPSTTPGAKAAGHPGTRPVSDRAKTRLLGFRGDAIGNDALDVEPVASTAGAGHFPIGWIVVVDGPGRGASFTLQAGLSTVGRDASQTIALDFGDAAISRAQHVAIAFDSDENCAFIGHGGKQNIVRHNGKPLLTTETLADRDTIKVGKTTLQFVSFCGPAFSWTTGADDGDA